MTQSISNFNPLEDTFTRRLVQRKANQLIGKYGYTEIDRDDLQQDMYLRVLQSLRSYDPDEGHQNKFITAVVERYVANIVRDRCAEKRCDADTVLLSTPLSQADGESIRVTHTLSGSSNDRHTGRSRRTDTEISQLRLDIQAVIDELPADWQQIVELRKSFSITEIAEQIGVARTTISARFQKIRERFAEAGLADYFQATSSART
ncbi:sigma-70 family RNA polymerase sigma factor [Crateriforma conspicua]|uniref:RNA polymerase sigma factor n=1 Tax=Crateriforma conspicua TaxID=2527996 RepID=A0A5C6FKV7_9PLAN|nr:sigma-70 family RNA polymerase sigma factor [Crateriforma conspicua]TWU61944.1 RNA polymerase sigma factor [Crateriforma conspicua]